MAREPKPKPKRERRPSKNPPAGTDARREPTGLRIVGGRLRGRKIEYSGQWRTRPMKDRVREAVFNLVGPEVAGKLAIDLFAGTGALGFEALSRGADRAVFIERHFPTAALMRRNAQALGVAEQSEVIASDTFLWARRVQDLGAPPWVVFCSPPYDFYVDRLEEMLALLSRLIELAPAESVFVVESDERFDPARLPPAGQWDVRRYPPAVVAVYRKSGL